MQPSKAVVEIYQRARNETMHTRSAKVGGLPEGASRYGTAGFLSPSIGEAIEKESRLTAKLHRAAGGEAGPGPSDVELRERARHRPADLLRFCDGLKADSGGDGADWGAAMSDPVVLAAMRRLQARVGEIGGGSGTFRPSQWANTVLNGRDASSSPRPAHGHCSAGNPLSSELLSKKYPLASLPRRSRLRAPPRPEPTSLWPSGWGANADERAVDLGFQFAAAGAASASEMGGKQRQGGRGGKPWRPGG